ncbi:MAG: fumarate reductase/succinate dehydrogenase flavoprotein subunit, partial [Akkermansia sp.]
LPGLFVLGEANFSDHGANRLGASALMQGLADGYFVIPSTLPSYITTSKPGSVTKASPEFKVAEDAAKARIEKLLSIKGNRSVDSFHRELGLLLWENCGMSRTKESLMKAIERIPQIREDFWKNVRVTGTANGINAELEKADRVADFLEFAQLMCYDALHRDESCGGHFRAEYQTEDGEALRNDDKFAYVAAWEYKGVDELPVLHKEMLTFDNVHLAVRSYK